MNIFKESRFVFEEPPTGSGGVESQQSVEKAPEKEGFLTKLGKLWKSLEEGIKPKAAKEGSGEEGPKTPEGIAEAAEAERLLAAAKIGPVDPEAIADAAKDESQRGFEEIKAEIAPAAGVRKLERVVNLENFTSNNYDFGTPANEFQDDLVVDVLNFYKKGSADWVGLKGLIKDTPEDKKSPEAKEVLSEKATIMTAMATAAAVSMVRKIEAGVKVRQSFYDTWKSGGKDVDITIEGTRKTEFKVVFSKEFEDARKTAADKVTADAAADVVANSDESKKLDHFIASPIGKILAWLPSYRNKETGKVDRKKLQAVLDGTDWFGAFIVGMFGYSEFDGGGFYDSVKDMLPENVKKSLGPLELRARATKYSAEAWRKTDKYKEGMGAGVEAAKKEGPKSFEVDDFTVEYLDADVIIPKEGVKLEEGFTLGDEYKVSIKPDAKIVIPKGKFLKIDGVDTKIDKDKDTEVDLKLYEKDFKISGSIPKGTVFAAVQFDKTEAAGGDAK